MATHELVADQLRRAIYLGRFLPGQRLPAERDLAAQLGVSRTTTREAVRLVVAEGLVESRRGATGGNFVLSWFNQSELTPDILAKHQSDIAEIFEFRIPIECAATRLAAVRRTEAELAELQYLSDRMDQVTATEEIRQKPDSINQFLADDNAFHLLIVRASRNAHLAASVEKVRAEMFLPIGAVFRHLEDNANVFHNEIVAAIRDEDPDAAEHAMRQHIMETYERLLVLLSEPYDRLKSVAQVAGA
jgi:DNA-binding FadR family transcriptional regulator